MAEQTESSTTDVGYVEFFSTGDAVKGEYHCSSCGYGVAVYRTLPRCPMCGGTVWEPAAWSPFGRSGGPVERLNA